MPAKLASFPIWKTIKIGTHKTLESLKQDIEDKGNEILDFANEILGNPAFTMSETEIELDLVNASLAELGFKDGAYLGSVYTFAQYNGLALCPIEAGPQLRRQYDDWSGDEFLIIAMAPIMCSDGNLQVLSVIHDYEGPQLGTCYGRPDLFLKPFSRLIFVRPRKRLELKS